MLPSRSAIRGFRESWSIDQNMQTPEDTEETEPILNDVPYAGLLAVQNAWIGYDDRDLFRFGWLLGIVGPASLAEPTQKGFHALINGDDPNGWSNQIDTEPVLNLYWERKHKLARARWGDLALAGGGNLGNLFTGAWSARNSPSWSDPPRG
ncbi:MAG TPA: lipid A-modifier LpxR family protein [Candidatus Polarisedimenticolaceae bacterium]|nr:lipid A-modifier LpxR family protein [Candidatus Polarisedimenticolaceae bacterium]